jgi:hypothetical protein
MFIATVSIIATNWKQPRCLSVDVRILVDKSYNGILSNNEEEKLLKHTTCINLPGNCAQRNQTPKKHSLPFHYKNF